MGKIREYFVDILLVPQNILMDLNIVMFVFQDVGIFLFIRMSKKNSKRSLWNLGGMFFSMEFGTLFGLGFFSRWLGF